VLSTKRKAEGACPDGRTKVQTARHLRPLYFRRQTAHSLDLSSRAKRMKASRAGKLVVVIDDDALVLEATEGLLKSWGCRVIAATSCDQAMESLAEIGQRPDLIVCDYLLPQGPTGLGVIETLRGAFEIPALLISGDGTLAGSDKGTGGYRLLHKPLNAETFRAVLVDASVLRLRD